jgi:small subunit ribosomal protein S9
MSEGKGDVTVNGKKVNEYFTTGPLLYKVNQAFELTDTEKQYNLMVNVYGGGITGQAEAIRMAIARALCEVNEEYRGKLKPEGLLTRDPRMVERKKFGQKKARKKFQFSKR